MILNLKIACLSLCFAIFYNCSKEENSVSVSSEINAPDCQTANESSQEYTTFFKPKTAWVGDPMPFFEDGKFHIFYLQDDRNTLPTFHPWYKVVSSDLATFTENSEVIPTGSATSQDGALGTGSVFKHNGKYYAFYTGHNGNLDPKEKILLATSTDLKTWTKETSFSLQASWSYDRNEFRDPVVFEDKNSGTFKMLIATRFEIGLVSNNLVPWRAVIAQYSSTNLLDWTLEKPFYEDTSTFITECPDVFIMGDFQYLVYSDIDDRMVHYKYRPVNSTTWIVPENNKLDGIAFYAGRTVSDGNNRYIMGWCPTKNKNMDSNAFDWAGSLVIHRLIQHQDGTFAVTIPEGINNKFNTTKVLNSVLSNGMVKNDNSYTLKSNSQKAISVFERESGAYKVKTHVKATSATQFGFEFGACGTRNEVYDIVFDLDKKQLRLDKIIKNMTPQTLTQIPLKVPVNKEFDVTIVSENSVCVVYVNAEIAFTNRIYKMNQNPWAVFTNNGEVTFSDLKIFK